MDLAICMEGLVSARRVEIETLSANDPRLHFGLGEATRVDRLEVRWPDGLVEANGPLPANRLITVRRGARECQVAESRGSRRKSRRKRYVGSCSRRIPVRLLHWISTMSRGRSPIAHTLLFFLHRRSSSVFARGGLRIADERRTGREHRPPHLDRRARLLFETTDFYLPDLKIDTEHDGSVPENAEVT